MLIILVNLITQTSTIIITVATLGNHLTINTSNLHIPSAFLIKFLRDTQQQKYLTFLTFFICKTISACRITNHIKEFIAIWFSYTYNAAATAATATTGAVTAPTARPPRTIFSIDFLPLSAVS